MGDRLRPAWDFQDLDATERRFRNLLATETTDGSRAEILTQLARVAGLRGSFADGDRLLDEAERLAESSPVVHARVALERGRLRRSSRNPEVARPLFETAFALALQAGETFIAVDAAHMVALVADRDGMRRWTERGIELAHASDDPAVRYWLGPLLNNLGWEHYAAGDYADALDAFERALEARERAGEPQEIEIARYALGKALRTVGRPAEAATLLEQCVAWAAAAASPDGWFHEELAEVYAALGREADARDQAQRALPLLQEADPDFAPDSGRAERLRELASE